MPSPSVFLILKIKEVTYCTSQQFSGIKRNYLNSRMKLYLFNITSSYHLAKSAFATGKRKLASVLFLGSTDVICLKFPV